jgi:hypothetical protein
MDKQTSKREFKFVTDSVKAILKIVDENDQEIREWDCSKFPATIKAQALVHGFKQKFTDDTMVSKLKEGESRLDACDALEARLMEGDWDKERQVGPRPAEALILFVMEAKKITREVAVASLRSAGKEKWEAIAAAHKDKIAEIQKSLDDAKKAAQATDLGDLAVSG